MEKISLEPGNVVVKLTENPDDPYKFITRKNIKRDNKIIVSIAGFDDDNNILGKSDFDFDLYGQNCTLNSDFKPVEGTEFGILCDSIKFTVELEELELLEEQNPCNIKLFLNGQKIFFVNLHGPLDDCNKKLTNIFNKLNINRFEKFKKIGSVNFFKKNNSNNISMFLPCHYYLSLICN